LKTLPADFCISLKEGGKKKKEAKPNIARE